MTYIWAPARGRTARVLFLLATLAALAAAASPAFSADEFEGFRRVDTEHFSFIYEPRDRDSVEELLEYADDVYEQIAGFLDNTPSGRIRVLVNGRTDLANGYFDPTPRHHIALFVASPSWPILGARSENWLEILFIHEVVHYVHFMYEQGMFHTLSRVFGRPLMALPGAFMPGWAVEGIAMEAETRFTGGGRGRNPYYEVYYSAPILEGEMFDYRRAAYMAHTPPRGRFYVAGLIFVDYLITEFGDDVFSRIHQEFLRGAVFSWDAAVEEVTGVDAEVLWDRMVEELEAHYAPRREIPKGDRFAPDHLADYQRPRIDNGLLYAYRTSPDSRAAIVRRSVDSESGDEWEPVVVTSLTDADSFDVRNGRIVFASLENSFTQRGPEGPRSRVYLREPDGNVRRIGETTGLYHPTFASDEHAIAVERRGQYHRLVWIDLDNGEVNPLYEPDGHYLFTPAVSPDGSTLAFAGNERGRQRIHLLSLPEAGEEVSPDGVIQLAGGSVNDASIADEKDIMRVIKHPGGASHYRPEWESDGTLLFISDVTGMLSGWRLSADEVSRAFSESGEADNGTSAEEIERIADDPVGVVSITSMPDGTRVYGTYWSKGHTIKRGVATAGNDIPKVEFNVAAGTIAHGERPDDGTAEASAEANEITDVSEASQGGPDGSQRTTAISDESRFFDLPLPGVWFPYLSITAVAGGRVDFGIGAGAIGTNYQRNASTTVLGAYHPAVRQPVGLVQLQGRIGRLIPTLTAEQSYTSAPEDRAEQRSALSATLQWNAIARSERGRQRIVAPFGTLRYDTIRRGPAGEDFAFSLEMAEESADNDVAEAPEDAFATGQRLTVGGGLSARTRGLNATRDLYTNRLLSGETRITRDIDGIGEARPGVHLRTTGRAVAPLGEAGSGATIAGGAAYSTEMVPSASPFPVEGVGGIANQAELPGRVRAEVGLHSTVALLDQPLPLGFNAQGIALAAYAESQAGFDLDGSFSLEPRGWLRFEVLTRLGYNMGAADLRLGLTVPVDESGPRAPGIYLGL